MNEKTPTNPQRKYTSPNPIKGLLSLKQVIPFENHPSARGLMKGKNIKEENNDNPKPSKRKSDFQISLNTIDDKIFQNEVYFEKNKNVSQDNNNCYCIQIPKKNTFNEKENEFDKDITSSIQRNEKSDVIINKFENFANIKNSNDKNCKENN